MFIPQLRWNSLSFRTKLILSFALLAIVISSFSGYLLYNQARWALREELRSKLMATTRTAALMVDPEKHQQLKTPEDESSSVYRELKAKLREVRDANPQIRYIYTMVKSSKNNIWKFVVDAEESPKLVSHLGDEYNVSPYPEMQKAFAGPAADKELTQDKWGIWLSGYTPIYDKSGRAIAILGLDMSANEVAREEAFLKLSATISLIITLILFIVLIILLSNYFTKSIQKLIRGTEHVAAGIFDKPVDIKSSDEIGKLARTFNRMVSQLEKTYSTIEQKIKELEQANKRLLIQQEINAKLQEAQKTMYLNSIKALVTAVDAKDPYTSGHSTRVVEHTIRIAKELDLEEKEIEELQFAALLHDIGKIGIADQVLRKVGPLEPDEQAIMMAHPVISHSILEKIDSLKPLLQAIKHHHEWYSGGGYPDGLKGENIPFDARILAVADAFESMTSPRRYRQALSLEAAISELNKGKGTQFDPEIVEALQRILNRERAANSHYFRELAERTHFQKDIIDTGSVKNRSTAPGQIRPIHGKEIAILSQIAQEIRSVLNLPTLLGHILDILKGIHGHKYYAILLKNEEMGDLIVEACRGFPPETVGLSIAASKGLVSWVAEHRDAQLVIDTTSDDRCNVGFPWNKGAEMAIPLVVEGQTIGVLDVQSEVPGEFILEDLELLKNVATQISAGVEVALLHEQVKRATAYDGLTGIYNHRYFYKRLEEELKRAQRDATPLSIVIFDIDKLKEINDTYGHLVGDAVLKETAHTLQENLRLSDVAARYGGDEFVVIMPSTTREEAESSTQRLMTRLDQRKINAGKNVFPIPGRSYGLATYPEDGVRPTELFTIADNRLLHKKRKRIVRATG